MMKGWMTLIQHLLDHDVHVAIVSGGLQKTATLTSLQLFPVLRHGGDVGVVLTAIRHENKATALTQNSMCSPTDG